MRSRAMPLERHIDDLTACDGIKFWMSDGERPVLCRVSHEALRDLAERVHFEGTDEKVFEAYRELIEQVASDAYDAGTSFNDAGLVAKQSTPSRAPCRWPASRRDRETLLASLRHRYPLL